MERGMHFISNTLGHFFRQRNSLMLKTLKFCSVLITFVLVMADRSSYAVLNSIEDAGFGDEYLLNNDDNNSSSDDHLIEECKEPFIKKCEELFIDVAQIEVLELIIFSISTITHELGHAIATESLFEGHDPMEIHIGTTTPEDDHEWFSLGNMHFYKTMPWIKGITKCRAWGRADSLNTNLSIMTAAGGLSAAALMYGLLSAITGYCAYCDNKGLFEMTLKSFINGVSPFSYILNTKNISFKQKRLLLNATLVICLSLIYNIFYGCTPYRAGDGVTIWKKYMGVTGTPLKVAHGLATMGVWGCWALLIKKYYDARKKLSPQDAHMPLLASLTSLFLMRKQLIPMLYRE